MSGSAPHSIGEARTGARGTGVRTFAVTGILRDTPAAASSLRAMADERQRASGVLDLASESLVLDLSSECDERPTTFGGDNPPAASRYQLWFCGPPCSFREFT